MADRLAFRSPGQFKHRGWFVPVYPCGHPDGYCLDKDYPEYQKLWKPNECRWCAQRRGEILSVYRLDCERTN